MAAGQEGDAAASAGAHTSAWGSALADRHGELEGTCQRGGGRGGGNGGGDRGNGGLPPRRVKGGHRQEDVGTAAQELVAEQIRGGVSEGGTNNGQWPKQGVTTTRGTSMTTGQNLVVGHLEHHSDKW